MSNKNIFVIALIAIIFLALIFQSSSSKLSSLINLDSRSSLASRQIIWQSSLLMLKQRYILGIGPGNFQENYLDLQINFPPYLEWAVPQPHNIFLAFWLETAFLGFVGFIYLLFHLLTILWKNICQQKNILLAAVSLLGFFLYLIIHGLVDTPYWKNDLAFIFWIFSFLVISMKKNLRKKS